MNKKNIFASFLLVFAMLMTTSCMKDYDDVFEQSASKRVNDYLEETRKVLMDAPEGWVLNYFPSRDLSYGGYAYYLKFDDQQVEARCDLFGASDSTITTYSLCNEDGPVLFFDTYSKILHYFTTPSGKSGAGGYKAYDGDHMFVIMGISKDRDIITLKGARSGNLLQMYKLNGKSKDCLKAISELKEDLASECFITNDTLAIMNIDLEARRAGFVDLKKKKSFEIPFVFGPTGISFYSPVQFLDKNISGFAYDSSSSSFKAVDAELELVALVEEPKMTLAELFVSEENTWYFSLDNQSPDYQQMWKVAINNLQTYTGESLNHMYVNGDVLKLLSGGSYPLAYKLSYVIMDNDIVKISIAGNTGTSTERSNANWYLKNVPSFANFLVGLRGTFKVEPANKRYSALKLVNVEDPSLYYIVTTSKVAPY